MRISFCTAAVFAAFIVATGCSSQRDFKGEQEAYEVRKKEREAEQSATFAKVESALRKKVEQIVSLTAFAENVSYGNDSTFFYKTDSIRFLLPVAAMGLASQSVIPNAMVVNTPPPPNGDSPGKNHVEYGNGYFVDRLRTCFRDTFYMGCYQISEEQLNRFLGVRYLFVVDEILFAEPHIDSGSKEFQSGGYLASVYVFDLHDKSATPKPLCTFPIMGSNSESIRISKISSNEDKLYSDLVNNSHEAFNKVCDKHFVVTEPMKNIHLY